MEKKKDGERPLVWLQMKFFLLCMARRVHKMFTKNQHSPLDSANNACYITDRTKEEEQKKSSESGVENVDNTQEQSESA